MDFWALLGEIRNHARSGSAYTKDEFDRRRYGRLVRGALAARMR